jgi:hypothetical protein
MLLHPEKWTPGTPERALADFLFAWSKGDLAAMFKSTCYSWQKSMRIKPAFQYLQDWFLWAKPKSATLLSTETTRSISGPEDIYAVYPIDAEAPDSEYSEMQRELAAEYIEKMKAPAGPFIAIIKAKIAYKANNRKHESVIDITVIRETKGLGVDPGGEWGVLATVAIPS